MPTLDNRSRLQQVALSHFATRGYDATGVQDIASEAGVTKPTLYHYFGSKLGLLDHLIRERAGGYLADLAEAARNPADLTGCLMRLVSVTLDFAQRQPAFYRFMLALSLMPAEHEARRTAAPYFDRQAALLEAMFEQAAQRHGNMRGRHVRYAATFLGHLNSVALMILDGRGQDSDSLRHDLVHQFSHGLYS